MARNKGMDNRLRLTIGLFFKIFFVDFKDFKIFWKDFKLKLFPF